MPTSGTLGVGVSAQQSRGLRATSEDPRSSPLGFRRGSDRVKGKERRKKEEKKEKKKKETEYCEEGGKQIGSWTYIGRATGGQ